MHQVYLIPFQSLERENSQSAAAHGCGGAARKMEGNRRKTEEGKNGDEMDDLFSHLSTKVVGAIRVVKEQISRIEFTYCQQIMCLNRETEKKWRAKEAYLVAQIEAIRRRKEEAEEEAKRATSSVDQDTTERLRVTTDELQKCKQMHETLLRQIEESCVEKEKVEEETDNLLKERAEKEKLVADLRDQVRISADELRHCRQLQETLLRQIDLKDLALLEEKSKVKKLSNSRGKMEERYKQLKSQYNFLLKKTGLTGESSSPISLLQKRKRPEGKQVPTNSHESEEDVMPTDPPSSPISSSIDKKDARSRSPWVDTRGGDAKDDFLDTQMDAVKPAFNQMAGNETEIVTPANKVESKPFGYKFVESVRKKAERETLKGIECKQCKKFYDAVLPSDRRNPGELRCEHHEGVSRHRYRHPPPMTPEGFWNIGFDSET